MALKRVFADPIPGDETRGIAVGEYRVIGTRRDRRWEFKLSWPICGCEHYHVTASEAEMQALEAQAGEVACEGCRVAEKARRREGVFKRDVLGDW